MKIEGAARQFPDVRHDGATALRKVQLVELRILRIIDDICTKNDLRYWLDGGTLLGAVRHGGFIPWDDDIDIVMPRADYERFLVIASEHLPADLEVETAETSQDRSYCYAVPCKIRDRHSKIVQAHADSQADDQKGLFVDVIPIDTFGDTWWSLRKDQFLKLIFRNLSKINDVQFSLDSGPHGWVHGVLSLFGSASGPSMPIRAYRAILKRFVLSKSFRNSEGTLLGYGFDVHWTRIFRRDDVFPLKRLDFEGFQFLGPANPDAVLKVFYGGGYMTLPEPRERRPKHLVSIMIDTRTSQPPEKLG